MEGVYMNRKVKVIAASLCAAQLAAMIPVTASAANTEVSVSTISAGANHTLVIKSDMTLWAAGDNSRGQLGLGIETFESNGSKVMDKVVLAEANDDVSFAIDQNGTLYGWGNNSEGQVDPDSFDSYIYKPLKLMEKVADVSSGDGHTLVLLQDGSVIGWGSNEYGELGFTANEKKNGETKIKDNAADIAAGDGFSLIVTRSGEVFACGNNDNGQLGSGGYSDISTPQKVIDSGAVKAEAGNSHSVVLMSDGTVKTSGSNSYGQLGQDKDNSSCTSFEKIGISNISSIFAGGNSTGAVNSSGVLYTWGANSDGQLHNGKTEDLYAPEKVTTGVVSIAFGEHHSVMMKTGGKVSTVGSGVYGELFSAQSSSITKPVIVSSKIVKYSAGTDHAAAIDENGRLYTWGNNSKGQLGLGDNKSREKMTLVKLDDEAVSVWCGNKVTIVQTAKNNTYVFGDNSGSMLGMTTKTSSITKPTYNEYLSDTPIDSIEFGKGFAIALIGGEVYGWGTNTAGRLCFCGKTVKYPEKLDDSLTNIVDIAAGDNHGLALTSGGQVYGWGSNSLRQLGSVEDRIVEEPVVIPVTDKKGNELSVRDIAAAGSHCLAVTSDSDVYAWGDNNDGQLGTDTYRLKSPTKVFSAVDLVYTSSNFSAVIKYNGDIILSGKNAKGQLGIGTNKDSSTFYKAAVSDVYFASLGGDFAGAINNDNKLYCWGNNTNGQVGNGNGGSTTDPQTVINNGLCLKITQAEKLTLDNAELSLRPGNVARLTAKVTPDDAVNKAVAWSSSNTSVATVDNNGLVKALKNGTAVITAKTSNGLSAQCTVTVSIPVSSFSVSPAKSKTMSIDGTFTFKTKIYPSNAGDKTLLYSSSNEDVAVVDEKGTVTAVSAGSAKITISAKTNPAKTRTVTVYVRPDKVTITNRTSDTDGITLDWTQSEYAEGYVVYRRNSAKGKGYNIGEVVSDDPDDLTFTDTKAVKGKIYYYYVKSYVTVGGKRIYSSASKIYKIKAK